MSTATPVNLVTTERALGILVDRLRERPRLAFDTESASFHRYRDRVYLVQVSSDVETALIDPLAVTDLEPLGRLLGDPGVEAVFHDADYDLRTIDRDYGFRATRLFDTRIAAQLAGEPAVGLGALLTKYFGVTLNKKLQRADWSKRPLSPDMVAYAADDTRHLLALRDLLADRLRALGRLSWAEEEFARLETVRWTGPAETEDAYLRIKGAKALPRRALAVLRSLHHWRDETARRLDRAPFRVLQNEALTALAKAAPTTLAALAAVGELPAAIRQRHGAELLDAVRRGLTVPDDELPRVQRGRRPPTDPEYDARVERLKLLRNRRAAALGLDPGLVCPNGTLQAIARARTAGPVRLDEIAELPKWQLEVMGGADILRTLER